MYATGTDIDMFAWQQKLGYGTHFNNHMGGYRQGRPPWMGPGFFPVKERLIIGADNSLDAPFLVDIGGSTGHDLAQFQGHHPNHPGKLILQDLPVVIGQIKGLDEKIEPMGYDFLEEQPVKGKFTLDNPFRGNFPITHTHAIPFSDLLLRCSCILHALRPP